MALAANQGKKRPRGRPFPPGVSGNPSGRPHDVHSAKITNEVRRLLAAAGETEAKAVAQKIVSCMKDGDARILSDMLDRLEGAAPLRVESDAVIRIEIVRVESPKRLT